MTCCHMLCIRGESSAGEVSRAMDRTYISQAFENIKARMSLCVE